MTASLLATDGYKFSMAEAGWPLRRETFYYTHRKGGLQVLPFDVGAELKALLPAPTPEGWAYLASHEYELGAGARAALGASWAQLTVRALPRLSIFTEREPVFSITGPSALVSWLEPLLLQWHYRVQVATLGLFEPERLPEAVGQVTCARQKALALEALDAVGVKAPPIEVREAAYVEAVRAQAAELVGIVGGPQRLFEVGLRAASCVEQHLLALEGCRLAGLRRTSHVFGAQALDLVPVGTMGHEHVQRYGSDRAAFRAMVDRRKERSSFLLDTFDTLESGLPAALEVMAERPGERDSIRYDSGDKEAQFREAVRRARAVGLEPVHILEDSFDAAQTRRFEALREELGVAPGDQVYGYGGFLVARPAGTPLTRDRVSAVFKLSQTGPRAAMKFGNESGLGKQSVPGRPVVFRREGGGAGPFGAIGQEGEAPPAGYRLLTGAASDGRRPSAEEARALAGADASAAPSEATRALMVQLSDWRARAGCA